MRRETSHLLRADLDVRKLTTSAWSVFPSVCQELVSEKKKAVLALANGKVEKQDLVGKDLLTSLGPSTSSSSEAIPRGHQSC